jgi:hypothetical protein
MSPKASLPVDKHLKAADGIAKREKAGGGFRFQRKEDEFGICQRLQMP